MKSEAEAVENSELKLDFHPVTPERWRDLETLFGPRGAIGGCWCMWWRIKRADFEKQQGEGNHAAMCSIIESGKVPGILAYSNGEAVAWCSVAPREDYPVLDRSPTLKRVDDQPVWSIVCFFIEKRFRNRGVSVQLLRAVIEYVKQKGGRILEGYPVEPKKEKMPRRPL